ncbi:sushi, nidogen and EGF-like domain-containing protein 1 [Scleropages formosus]|nr:sushi, nidogen and EGF-like domain-containing protein 1 [Scleropages formosus]
MGLLTFDQSVSSSYPYLYTSYVAIAPLWSYWNNAKSGVISYRQVTSGSDLQRATSDINQYFPQLNFVATWVFIATWDSVAFNNMDTETSFQVVLISNGGQSFVLFNYGRISDLLSNTQVQAGYSSGDSAHYYNILWSTSVTGLTLSKNVNVSGRWVFQTSFSCVKAYKVFLRVHVTSKGLQLNPKDPQLIQTMIENLLSGVSLGDTCSS